MGPLGQKNLRATLTQELNAKQAAYYRLSRSALATDDAVDSFMSLYRILENLQGERQKDIDAAIIQIDPTVKKLRIHAIQKSRKRSICVYAMKSVTIGPVQQRRKLAKR